MSTLPDHFSKLVIHQLTGDFRSSTSVTTQAWVDPGPGEVVVRNRWADVSDPIDFRVEGHAPVTTVPESLVWLRLEPGRHQLALSWNGADVDTTVEGGAGDVRFVEIVGSAWAWGRSYTWMADDEAGARKRALASRLIAVREDSR